jgi:hypothetical protein
VADLNDPNFPPGPAVPRRNCTDSVATVNYCLGQCDGSTDLTVSILCDGSGAWDTAATGADACTGAGELQLRG